MVAWPAPKIAPPHELAYWKDWVLRLLQNRLTGRVAPAHLTEHDLDSLAAQVAERQTDPYTAVTEISTRAGLS